MPEFSMAVLCAVVILAIFLVGFAAGYLVCRYRQPSFESTHPELTDEEYLQLFDWPVNPEVALKVRHILADLFNLPESRIRPQDRLFEDLKLD